MNAPIAKLVRDAFANQRTYKTNYYGPELVVEYDYQPAEPMNHWEPGCPEELTITAITVNGVDIQAVMSQDIVDALEREVLAAIHEARELRREEDQIAREEAWLAQGYRLYSTPSGIEPRY